MNKYKELAEIFGLELNERFNIKRTNGEFNTFGKKNEKYYISENGLKAEYGHFYMIDLFTLLEGRGEVVKIPFKPNLGDKYWYYSINTEEAMEINWDNSTFDYVYLKSGNCFRTREEAETKGKEIMESIM